MESEEEIIRFIWKILCKESYESMNFEDAVAIKIGRKYIVLNIDGIEENSVWIPGFTAYDIGWRAVIGSLSDIFVKGATPLGIITYIGLNNSFSLDFLSNIIRGMRDAAAEYNTPILGGDLGRSKEFIMVVTSIGITDKVILRKGAKVGDIVYTTGLFGETSLLYKCFLENLCHPICKDIFNKNHAPKPKFNKWVKILRYASSSIDSSDGLAKSLYQLAQANNAGIIIENIPISINVRKICDILKLDYVKLCLYEGGEEFEAIFTISPEQESKVIEIAKENDIPIYRLGKVVAKKGVWIKTKDKLLKIQNIGWDKLR